MSRPTTAPMTTPAAVSHGPMVVVITSSSKHTALGIHRRSSRSIARALRPIGTGRPARTCRLRTSPASTPAHAAKRSG